MLQLKGFDHVAINIGDMERSKRFFMEVLGLSYVFELHPKHIYLRCGLNMLALVEAKTPRTPRPAPRTQYLGIGAVNHLSFRVDPDQFDQAVQALQLAKVAIERGPVDRPEEGSRSIYFRDPDGHRLELTAWTKEP